MTPEIERLAKEAGSFQQAARLMGALVTDGPVDARAKPQWGRPPFLQGKMIAHFWTADDAPIPGYLDAYGIRSACGLTTVATKNVPLCGYGNLPFCAKCDRKLLRTIRAKFALSHKTPEAR